MKMMCSLKMVMLKKGNETIEYGDLTRIANDLPKSKVIVVNGAKKRVKINYTPTEYEQWQHNYTDQIVDGLNELLPTIVKKQQTMYYYTTIKQVMVRV